MQFRTGKEELSSWQELGHPEHAATMFVVSKAEYTHPQCVLPRSSTASEFKTSIRVDMRGSHAKPREIRTSQRIRALGSLPIFESESYTIAERISSMVSRLLRYIAQSPSFVSLVIPGSEPRRTIADVAVHPRIQCSPRETIPVDVEHCAGNRQK